MKNSIVTQAILNLADEDTIELSYVDICAFQRDCRRALVAFYSSLAWTDPNEETPAFQPAWDLLPKLVGAGLVKREGPIVWLTGDGGLAIQDIKRDGEFDGFVTEITNALRRA